jgi:uncharacterized protein
MLEGRVPEPEEAVEIPYTSLQTETLRAVVIEFVSREGTDYGVRERTMEQKVEDVMRQLRRGEAKIFFDPETNSINLVAARPGRG